MQRDPAPSRITGVSELGLIQMTRKRSRESLAHTLCEECPACQGRGIQKSAQTVCYDIMRQIMRDARASDRDTLMVLAAQVVVDRLLQEEADNVSNLEKFIGKTISFRAQPGYSQEHFDIVLL
jgi:ribonuclease G